MSRSRSRSPNTRVNSATVATSSALSRPGRSIVTVATASVRDRSKRVLDIVPILLFHGMLTTVLVHTVMTDRGSVTNRSGRRSENRGMMFWVVVP